ncbi:hypothetical protein [Actinokineospora fastidiosa]|uniref:Uncharacterized protein n=1 Tax=Actinokineospora fastidiosa TaxID=1816 RepID=A0A918L8H8_9PSEU|nr:hypothetical protein GCM10010171_10670 [Actinokineospora fastidiosa]
MSALVLACGNDRVADTTDLFTDSDVRAVPARPDRAAIDPLLTGVERVIVHGTDADLAAVALRLMRKERLETVSVGYVPTKADSVVRALWDLPADPRRAAELALRGEVDPVPLVRDDTGGVLVGLGVLPQIRGVVYCDDTVALRGRASRIEVNPARGAGLEVRVIRIGLLGKRVQTFHGRAVQAGCLPVIPRSDGVDHPREAGRWTWYRHTADLRLVRGLL